MRAAQACIEELDRGKRYRVSVELPRDPVTGKRRRKYKTIRGSRKDAEKARSELLRMYDKQDICQVYTLEEYCLEVFLPEKKGEIKQRTYETYVARITKLCHILGHIPLQELTSSQVRRYLGTLKPTVAKETRRMLHTICQSAVYNDVLATNPIARVKPPKVPKYEPEVLDINNVQVYLQWFRDTEIEAVILLALGCGLRRGEICALNVEDIDPVTGAITVDDAYVLAQSGKVLHTTPKSASGYRTVHMPASLLTRLVEIMPASGPMLAYKDGSRMSPDSISKRYRRLQTKMPDNVPRISLKNLRHTSLTLAYDSGVDLLAVSRRAGHSNTRITADYYVRPKGERDRQAAALVDQMLLGS